MEDLAEQLILTVLEIVRRDWRMLSSHWQRMFEIDLADDLDAQPQFAMAVLAVGLGDNPPATFHQAVHQSVVSLFKSAGGDLEKNLRQYEAVWANWKNISGKFVVPPLEHRHEAIGIVFSDAANIRPIITVNGMETYNLFVVAILGMCITNTCIEVNKAFQ